MGGFKASVDRVCRNKLVEVTLVAVVVFIVKRIGGSNWDIALTQALVTGALWGLIWWAGDWWGEYKRQKKVTGDDRPWPKGKRPPPIP